MAGRNPSDRRHRTHLPEVKTSPRFGLCGAYFVGMEFASEDQATCGQCLKRLERIKAWKGNLWRYKKHPSPSAEITVRLRNALTRHLEKDDVTEDDIRRLSELDDESLTGIKGFGVKCLKEVRDYFGPLLSEEAP